ncbi:biopolymer transporter ExbD [bacterium]|nr:biopolymer transporter ExbD [bacterium]MBU1984664.1 biopolymer transporter ExbD [bacterium]
MARRNLFADVTTSFIDLAFNLLLFFVISLVIVPENVVPIRLPRSSAAEETTLQVSDDLVFYVLRDGTVLVEDQLLADSLAADTILFARADTVIAQYHQAKPEGRLILKADSGAVWDRPVQVMQAAGKHGMPLSIALEPQIGR